MMSNELEGYVKILLTYDILPDAVEGYHQYMLGEMVPKAQVMGLGMVEAWHTAVGDYPIRLIAFVVENYNAAKLALNSDEWIDMEKQLQEYVTNYSCRVVPLRDRFQF